MSKNTTVSWNVDKENAGRIPELWSIEGKWRKWPIQPHRAIPAVATKGWLSGSVLKHKYLSITLPRVRYLHAQLYLQPAAIMFRQIALVAFAFLPFSLAQVSEGFENGWDQAAWPTYAADCNQGGKVTLDSSTAHNGTKSMRVDGAGGYCGHIFFGTSKIPSGDVYVRAYMWVRRRDRVLIKNAWRWSS